MLTFVILLEKDDWGVLEGSELDPGIEGGVSVPNGLERRRLAAALAFEPLIIILIISFI